MARSSLRASCSHFHDCDRRRVIDNTSWLLFFGFLTLAGAGAGWAYAQSRAKTALIASHKKIRDRRKELRQEPAMPVPEAGRALAASFGRR